MRNSTALITTIAASALLLAAPASADPIITGSQILGIAGSAAGGAVGGPVGGFVGGLVARNLGKVFQKKPAKLIDAQAPPHTEVQPVQAQTPAEVRTLTPDEATIPAPDQAALQQARSEAVTPPPADGRLQQATDVSSSARPASGTLDAQLWAIQHGASPSAQ